MKILDINKLNYSINSNHILKNISFSIQKGEVINLIGPNGSGKTTLLRCIARYLKPSSGKILFSGNDTKNISQKKFAEHIGYIPQKTILSYPFTVEEFIAMGRYPYSNLFDIHDNKHDTAVNAAIEDVKISHLRHRTLTTLSGGELQKILIAGCLAQQPDIFLLDEVMSHLDPHFQLETAKLLVELKKKKKLTVLSVTHNINLAVLISDKILILKQGKIVFFDSPVKLNGAILKKIFSVDFRQTGNTGTDRQMFMPCWEIINE